MARLLLILKLRWHTYLLRAKYRVSQRVSWEWDGLADWRERRIYLHNPVQDVRTYTIFMHEMGHIVSSGQKRARWLPWWKHGTRWDDEVDAWRWAQENSLIWTPQMEDFKTWALSTYAFMKPGPSSLEEIRRYAEASFNLPPSTF